MLMEPFMKDGSRMAKWMAKAALLCLMDQLKKVNSRRVSCKEKVKHYNPTAQFLKDSLWTVRLMANVMYCILMEINTRGNTEKEKKKERGFTPGQTVIFTKVSS